MKIFKILILLSVFPISLFSQEINLASSTIPKNLIENADAVVRLNEEIIVLDDFDKMIRTGKRIVTVLNKRGDRNINLYQYYDDDTKISKIAAFSYNQFGKEIRKYSKSDFKDLSATDNSTLASDSRLKLLDFTPTSYPYTIVFEYEVKTKTTGFIPSWFPIENYSLSIQKSSFTIQNPKNLALRFKEKYLEGYAIQNKSNGNSIHYEMENQTAIKHEDLSPNAYDFFPQVVFGLNKFSLKGIDGEAKDWKELGKWQYDYLIKEKENLPQSTKEVILNLVKKESDTLAKAKLIYNYMQQKTRYISVQLGIGGWTPSASEEVDRLGYGDCKGLSNYTKTLMDAAGIKSYYTIVYADTKRNIEKDFHSMQGNHIILNLPYKGKDIWLECTSQTKPFGFLGDFTDDRDVLVITPDGGVIKHTPVYKNETNSETTESELFLDDKGNLTGKVSIISKGINYDNIYPIETFDKKELDRHYKSLKWNYNNNLELEKYSFNNLKDSIIFKENLEISIANFSSFTENNLLFRCNVFNRYTEIPDRYRNRKLPFKIERGFMNKVSYKIHIPENYSIGNLPNNINLTTEFGTYSISFEKINSKELQYTRHFLLKEGNYPKEKYADYLEFIKSVDLQDGIRIALTKK